MALNRVWDLFHKLNELRREAGIVQMFRNALYFDGEIVPVEKDLSTVESKEDFLREKGLELKEITPDAPGDLRRMFQSKDRCYKAERYLKRGYGCFALMRGDEAIGDIWYVTNDLGGGEAGHKHLKWLSLTLKGDEVYLFDMYVQESERGKALAAPLMRSALARLGRRKYAKAYGYYMADNVSALWVHRMLKYKELPKIRFSRRFFVRIIRRPRDVNREARV